MLGLFFFGLFLLFIVPPLGVLLIVLGFIGGVLNLCSDLIERPRR